MIFPYMHALLLNLDLTFSHPLTTLLLDGVHVVAGTLFSDLGQGFGQWKAPDNIFEKVWPHPAWHGAT